MCTVSWLRGEQALRLHVSRDESLSRRRARPPDLHDWGGVRALAPLDPDRHGTWLGANEHRLVLTLLNGSMARPPRVSATAPSGPGRISRGQLVRELLVCSSWGEVETAVRRRDLDELAAFTLVAIGWGEEPRAVVWDESRIELVELSSQDVPLASSTFDPDGVPAVRREVFEQLTASAEEAPTRALEAFHRSHLPHRGAYSPCMHRADAATVSYTVVEVTPERIRMDYLDGPPCEAAHVFRREMRI
jgi:hypothetical protein